MKNKFHRTEIFARIMAVQLRKSGAPLRIQVVTSNGRVQLPMVNEAIYRAVLGERRGAKGNLFSMGLRKLTGCSYRAHFDDKDVIQALDIIPNRHFMFGVAPSMANDAKKKGFEVWYDASFDGFDIWTEDKNNEKRRTTYVGLSENMLCDLLDELRKIKWSDTKRSHEALNHRFERIEDNRFRIKPLAEPAHQ